MQANRHPPLPAAALAIRLWDRLRAKRLLEREGDAHRTDWAARWTRAEEHYFSAIMPPERFDLVLHSV